MNLDTINTLLIDHFKEIVPLSEADILSILPKLEVKVVKRKEFVLQEGQISKHMRFIVKGSLYAYYMEENGKEHIAQLGIEHWWINDLYSYLSELPSRIYIRANEDTTLIQISKRNLEVLYKEVPALSEFWRLKIQHAYVNLQERTFENVRSDAYTKYHKFISDYPTIEQRFPQYMIASYLGITVEYLSFLRKKHLSRLS